MNKVFIGLTAIFGLFWLVFGLNNFLHFFPIPEPSEEGANFLSALEATGYALPVVYATQVIAGLMLLSRRFVALALALLAPVIANILLYDLFLNTSGLVIGGIVSVIYLALVYDNKCAYQPLFKQQIA
ncbi:MAG: hypothetical protein JKY71_10480 [Alphaproteobacteria bacterium]|nr:hypothetical protein [Alphaproteobacteria bacterium]